MTDYVILKGFNKGIAIILDSSADFELILDEFKNKVIAAKNFFSGNELAIQFVGRKLTSDHLFNLIDILKTYGGVHDIIFLWDQINFQNLLGYKEEKKYNNNINVFKGTVRSGQVIESNGDAIILGDVNPGGLVCAEGNIFVLGALRGIAQAGNNDNDKAIVFALELKPTQIRIGKFIARAPDDQYIAKEPEVAYVENDYIVIKSISDIKGELNII